MSFREKWKEGKKVRRQEERGSAGGREGRKIDGSPNINFAP